MKKEMLRAWMFAAILLGFSANSQAIMINTWNHDPESDPADYALTVNQVGGGDFNFNLQVTGGNADLYGFFFNLDDTSSNYTPLFLGANVGVSIIPGFEPATICGYDTTDCGGGNNLNGLPFASWDVGIQFGVGSPIQSTAAIFSLPSLGYSLDDFESFGIRSLSTGDDREGSDKAWATPTTTQVPEPASMALMGLGLVGLGLTRRKKKLS